MKREEIEDLTSLFLSLQAELIIEDLGSQTSLGTQLSVIETDLAQYFVNPKHLRNCLRIGGLTYEHAFLKKNEKWSGQHLPTLLREYRRAQAADEEQLFSVLAQTVSLIDKAYEQNESITKLQDLDTKMNPNVFTKSCLRNMGDLIESCLFPFARIRLMVLEIARGKNLENLKVGELGLGQVIAKLLSTDSQLYSPEPFGITVSQWRNISHHSSYRVINNSVHIKTGKNRLGKEFECSISQLVETLQYVNDLYYLHKVVYEFFCVDNAPKLSKAVNASNKRIPINDFTYELTADGTIVHSLFAAGFHIVGAARQGKILILNLRDLHDRKKGIIKSALQEAIVPYLYIKGRTQMNANVESQGEMQFVSFVGHVESSDGEILDSLKKL